MASIITWALMLLAAVAASGSTHVSRIVGGEETSIENHPSIVQVEFLNVILWQQACAGNILTTIFVLSAAQCFSGILFTSQLRRIRAGSSNRGSGGTIIGVERIINHPTYGQTPRSSEGDITVVRLSNSLVYNDFIRPGAILSAGFQIPDNIPVVAAGWGATEEDGPPSRVLRRVEVLTVNREICRQRYTAIERPVTENMICSGMLDVGGKDACLGDSGGPLYLGEVIIGITSWGYGCASPEFPGVYTSVASFTNWILETVQRHS